MGGGKGGDNAPPDSDMMRMSLFPSLIDPYKAMAKRVQGYYGNQGNAPEYGPNVVAGWNPAQQAAYRGAIGTAKGGLPGAGEYTDWLGGQVGQTGGDQFGNSFYENLGRGKYENPGFDMFSGIADRVNQPGNPGATGIQSLQKFASGKYMGKNPYLMDQYKAGTGAITEQFRDATMPSMEGMITRSGAGGGGGVEALLKKQAYGELGDSLGDYGTNLFGNAYQSDMGNMLSAAGQLPGAFGQQTQTKMAAAQGLSDSWQRGLADRITGIQGANAQDKDAFERNLAAGQNLGGAFQNQFLPFNMMGQWGGQQQQQQERQNTEAQNRFRWNDTQSGNFLNQYLQAFGGLAGIPNMSGAAAYATQQAGQPSAFQQAIGNITGLAGASMPYIGMGMGYNPFGGAALGTALNAPIMSSAYGSYNRPVQ